jgi:hypothetical protein
MYGAFFMMNVTAALFKSKTTFKVHASITLRGRFRFAAFRHIAVHF